MNTTAGNSEPDYPYPSRFWWTRRVAAVVIVVLLITLGVRIWWGRGMQARFDSTIAAIHAAGEPILPADFNQPILPDEQNYVFYLRKALSSLNYDTYGPSGSDKVFPDYLPMPPEWQKLAREAEAGNATSLQLIRQARQLTQVDWGFDFRSPTVRILLPGLNDMRQLANVLGDVALYQHLQGRDDEAIQTLLDLVALGSALEKQPFLVSHLVSIGILAMGCERAEIIAPGLSIAESPAQPHAATRAQVRTLIDQLFARGDRTIRYAALGERMIQLDENQWLTARSTLLRPMFQQDAINAIQDMQQYVSPTTIPSTLPARARGFGIQTSTDVTHLISSMTFPSLNRVYDTDARVRAEAFAAGIALAARMYQIDHDGKWPPSLDALVPTYMPKVPMNPRSSRNIVLRYLPTGNGSRPLLYLDTYEGDLTPDLARLPAHPMSGWQTGGPQFRDLSRFPATSPATQPVEGVVR